MNTALSRPDASEHDAYYLPYLGLVTETDILEALETQLADVRQLLGDVTDENANCLHEPYTWTIKQAYGYCIDNERVFGYRACRFAVKDETDLPGYDQDAFVTNTDYSYCSMSALIQEMENVRFGNLLMLKRLAPECWDRRGTADGKQMTVRAIAWLLVGHLRHHLKIFEKRLAN